MDHKQLYEEYLGKLANISKKKVWEKWLVQKDGKTPLEGWDRHITACMLENEFRYINNLEEDVRAINIGSFAKYALPIVRHTYPNLISKDLVAMQPMPGPISLVFYRDVIYGSNKGRIRRGDTAFGSQVGHATADSTYSSETVPMEVPAGWVGDGGTTSFGSSVLAYHPIRPGSVVGETIVGSVTVQFQDDGAGGIVGPEITSGTVNYTTGAIAVVFADAPDSLANISISYTYDSEGNADTPSLEFVISSVPVQAMPRKLRIVWSVEAQQDYAAIHGGDAEADLVADVGEQFRYETDREVITDLLSVADSTSVGVFDLTPGLGQDPLTHKMLLPSKFIQASGVVHRKVKKQIASAVVMGENVSNEIESLPTFKGDTLKGDGVIFVGKLNNRWDCYRDPDMDPNTYLVVAKGTNSTVDAGYVLLPYIPLYTTATYELDDMKLRKGLMTRYAKKIINKNYYVKGLVTQS